MITKITARGFRALDSGPNSNNTYHVVVVELDDTEVWRSPVTYGYGDHYLQTAYEWLSQVAKIVPDDGRSSLQRLCRHSGIELVYNAVDVSSMSALRRLSSEQKACRGVA